MPLLVQAFSDLSRDARRRGWWGLIWLWIRVLPDLVVSALDQPLRRPTFNPDWHFRKRWLNACVWGVLLGMICHLMMKWVPATMTTKMAVDCVIFSLAIGGAQVRHVTRGLREALAWIGLSALGGFIAVNSLSLLPQKPAFGMSDDQPMLVALLLIASIVGLGLSLGIAQAVFFRKRRRAALAWIVANGFAIPSAILAGFVAPLLLWLLPGVVFGIITVGPLEWIMQEAGDASPDGEYLR
jgi:hypothetical protein